MLSVITNKKLILLLVMSIPIVLILMIGFLVHGNSQEISAQPPVPGIQVTNRAVGAGNITVTLVDTDNGSAVGTYNGDIARFTCDGRRLVIRRTSPSLGIIVVDSVTGAIIGEFAAATQQGIGDFSCSPIVTHRITAS